MEKQCGDAVKTDPALVNERVAQGSQGHARSKLLSLLETMFLRVRTRLINEMRHLKVARILKGKL